MEKLHMGTAKQFSFLLRETGQGARFSKFDIRDTYKLIPAKVSDNRLQGFKWLKKYFVEVMMSFGGKPSPCNFDRLAKTKDLLVCIRSRTPRYLVPRALDDSPSVAPKDSNRIDKFKAEMKAVCKEANIALAESCPLAEKAFESATRGPVLGVGFDSDAMQWFLSKEKSDRTVRKCLRGIDSVHMDLNQIQKIMGSVNDLAQMCPLVKFHKRSGNAFMRTFGGSVNILRMTPEKLKQDLAIIAKVVERSVRGLPIADRPAKPSLAAVQFYTDAAGASFTWTKGKRIFHNNDEKGVSCIGGSNLGNVWGWSKIVWPRGLLTEKVDKKGSLFGCKSTTLESVGLLIPLLVFPDLICGREIVFKMDNMAVMWGWQNGHVKNDAIATEILKSVSYISGYLGSIIHVEHVGRMSEDLAELADELSRRDSSKDSERREILRRALYRPLDGFLLEWLEDPCQKGDLCSKLLGEIRLKFPC